MLASEERLSAYSNGSLVIDSVTSGDDGSYTCTATSRRGLSSARTAYVKVIGRCQAKLRFFIGKFQNFERDKNL